MERRLTLDRLLHPVFLAALVLLLLNDHLLKDALHNWWTGKLSDFAGVYAWAWCWTVLAQAVWPSRHAHRVACSVHLTTALAFTVYQLPVADGFVDWWSDRLWGIYRTRDLSDVIALTVLVPCYRMCRGELNWLATAPSVRWRGLASVCALVVAWGSFVATSDDDFPFRVEVDLPIDTSFAVASSPADVMARIQGLAPPRVEWLDSCLAYWTPPVPTADGAVSASFEFELVVQAFAPAGTAVRPRRVRAIDAATSDGEEDNELIASTIDTLGERTLARVFRETFVRGILLPEEESEIFVDLCRE